MTTAYAHKPELERPPCAVCDLYADTALITRKGYQLVRCRLCGLVYVSPRPRSRAAIEALYTNDQYSRLQVAHSDSRGRMREARWRAAQLDRHVRANRGRLLDVGCSAGSFLLAARDRGWDVHGIDISPAAVDHALDVLGLGATLATLEDAPFPHESFDVITLFECIEHLPHPTRALLSASRLLRPDGLLVITTPNIDGFVPRSTYQLLARTIGAWEHPTPPHHLYQFSRRTLTALLRKTGFEVLAYATRPMGLKFTVKQMESAVVEACKRRLPLGNRAAAAGRPDPRALKKAAPRGSIAKRGARALVSSLCWSLTAALYAVPIHWMGAGDSMLVVARKAR